MDRLHTFEQVVSYLQERWKILQTEREEYEDDHPNGSEDVEDSISEGSMEGAETEIAQLLTLVGANPYPNLPVPTPVNPED